MDVLRASLRRQRGSSAAAAAPGPVKPREAGLAATPCWSASFSVQRIELGVNRPRPLLGALAVPLDAPGTHVRDCHRPGLNPPSDDLVAGASGHTPGPLGSPAYPAADGV